MSSALRRTSPIPGNAMTHLPHLLKAPYYKHKGVKHYDTEG